MAEYFGQTQLVSLNEPIEFSASIPCNKGCVFHEDGTGIFTLKGVTNNCFARYQLTFNGNVAIPEGGELSAVGVAIAVQGEARAYSKAIYTPQAVDEYGNLTSTAIVTVPRGCCFSASVRYVDATTLDTAVDPTPTIEVANANLTITRIA